MVGSGDVGDNSASLWYISRISSSLCLPENKNDQSTQIKKKMCFLVDWQSHVLQHETIPNFQRFFLNFL